MCVQRGFLGLCAYSEGFLGYVRTAGLVEWLGGYCVGLRVVLVVG